MKSGPVKIWLAGLSFVAGATLSWGLIRIVRPPEPPDQANRSMAIRYAHDYFAMKVIPETEASLHKASHVLGRLLGDLSVRAKQPGSPLADCDSLASEIGRLSARVDAVSPVVTTRGMSRLQAGATVQNTVIGCSLPVIEEKISRADGILYWQCAKAVGGSPTSQTDSLPEAIVNARTLGVHPSKTIGTSVTVTIPVSDKGVVGTKSLVFRIRGVFDPGTAMPDDSIYIPLQVLRSMTGQKQGECSEVWVWFHADEGGDSHAADRGVIVDSILKYQGRVGILVAEDLIILDAGQRYPKYLVPMERALGEAREVADSLSQECAK